MAHAREHAHADAPHAHAHADAHAHARTIHTHNSHPQFIRTINTQFIRTIHTHNSYAQFIRTIHTHNSYAQFLPTLTQTHTSEKQRQRETEQTLFGKYFYLITVRASDCSVVSIHAQLRTIVVVVVECLLVSHDVMLYVRMCSCMYVFMYVCIHVCLYVCIHVCICVCVRMCALKVIERRHATTSATTSATTRGFKLQFEPSEVVKGSRRDGAVKALHIRAHRLDSCPRNSNQQHQHTKRTYDQHEPSFSAPLFLRPPFLLRMSVFFMCFLSSFDILG